MTDLDGKGQKNGRFGPKMRRFGVKIGGFAQKNVSDACLLAGFLMVGYGLWRIYHPIAWIVCGAMLLWVGIPPKPQNPPREGRRN